MESSWEERLQGVSQEIRSLHKALQPVLEFTERDLPLLRAQLGRSLSEEEDTAKRSFSEDDLAELEKKLGERGHSQAGLHLAEGKCPSTDKASRERD